MFTNYKKKYQELLIEFKKVKLFESILGSHLHETAHVISNIGAILNSLENKSSVIPNDIRKDLDNLRRNFNTLKAIHHSGRHFYRTIESNKDDEGKIVFNLFDAIYELKKLVSHELNEKDINIITDPYIKDILIDGSISKLQTILLSIIKNSIESFDNLHNSKEIVITLKPSRKEVAIEIEDNGNGIPEDLGERIFGMGVTTKKDKQGFGLSIAKQMIEQDFNGTIAIISFKKPTIIQVNIPHL
jgi:signal transduction histidine kinase